MEVEEQRIRNERAIRKNLERQEDHSDPLPLHQKRIKSELNKLSEIRDYEKKYKNPKTVTDVIEAVYKKQIPDMKPRHLEMEEVVKKKLLTSTPQPKKAKVGGAMVVEGAVPVPPPAPAVAINSVQQYAIGRGEPKAEPKRVRSEAMKRRSEKIKEIMKSQNLSMIAASQYIKTNGIKY